MGTAVTTLHPAISVEVMTSPRVMRMSVELMLEPGLSGFLSGDMAGFLFSLECYLQDQVDRCGWSNLTRQ